MIKLEYMPKPIEDPCCFALRTPNGFVGPDTTSDSKFAIVYSEKPWLSGISGIRTMRYRMMTQASYEEVCATEVVRFSSVQEHFQPIAGRDYQPLIRAWRGSVIVRETDGEIDAVYHNQPGLENAFSYLKNAGMVNEHLTAIEQHGHTHTDRADRYFIVLQERKGGQKMYDTTNMVGNNKRFIFAPHMESLVIFKLFFNYPIVRIYDFQEKKLVNV